jgi:hypothetical protein
VLPGEAFKTQRFNHYFPSGKHAILHSMSWRILDPLFKHLGYGSTCEIWVAPHDKVVYHTNELNLLLECRLAGPPHKWLRWWWVG